jgi:uncharacterized protein YceH (UPF0502 family)
VCCRIFFHLMKSKMTETRSFRTFSFFGSATTSKDSKNNKTKKENREIAELRTKLEEQREIIELQRKQLDIFATIETENQARITELQNEVASLKTILKN